MKAEEFEFICSKCQRKDIKAIKTCYCKLCNKCFLEFGKKIYLNSYEENLFCELCKSKTGLVFLIIFEDFQENKYKLKLFLEKFEEKEIFDKTKKIKKKIMEDHYEKRKELFEFQNEKKDLEEEYNFLIDILMILFEKENVSIFDLETEILLNKHFLIFKDLVKNTNFKNVGKKEQESYFSNANKIQFFDIDKKFINKQEGFFKNNLKEIHVIKNKNMEEKKISKIEIMARNSSEIVENEN